MIVAVCMFFCKKPQPDIAEPPLPDISGIRCKRFGHRISRVGHLKRFVTQVFGKQHIHINITAAITS